MKLYLLRRQLLMVDGTPVAAPIGYFSDPELMKREAAEDGARLQAAAAGVVVLPDGQRIPFRDVLAAMGIKSIGNDLGEVEVKSSALIAPEPRLILAR